MLRGKKASLKLTKTDKARVIICALYGLKELPASEDRRVRIEARRPMSHVNSRHATALCAIEQRACQTPKLQAVGPDGELCVKW